MSDCFDPDDFVDSDEPDQQSEQRCKFCGERGLYWEERGRERFVLVDENGDAHAPHCKGKVADLSEFPEG